MSDLLWYESLVLLILKQLKDRFLESLSEMIKSYDDREDHKMNKTHELCS